MEAHHVLDQELTGLHRRQELWMGKEMSSLGKPINYSQDDLVVLGGRKASDEGHCDVRP